jgi:alpha-glucosidase
VIPAESTRDLVKTYLPEGVWYDFYSNARIEGSAEVVSECPMELLPLYVKAGAIIPMQPTIQYADQPHNGVLDIHLYKTDSSGEFVYYEDDGISYDFEKGAYHKRLMRLERNGFSIAEAEGDYSPAWQNIRLIFHGFEDLVRIEVNGSMVATQHEVCRMIEPVSSFDPLGKQSLTINQYNTTALIGYSHEAIEINW